MAEVPLIASDPKAGSVILHVQKDFSTYDTLFSFTLYYRKSLEEFQKTIYYEALKIYAEIIHSAEYPVFANTGMILYTDTASRIILMESFSAYPKIIIAETIWPQFMTSEITLDDTILRTIRYHAIEAFPRAKILIRDADSLFPYEIKRLDYMMEDGGEIEYKPSERGLTAGGFSVVQDPMEQLKKRISAWEIQFLEKWNSEIRLPIVIGTENDYKAVWHYNTAFRYSPKATDNPNILNHPIIGPVQYNSYVKDRIKPFAFIDVFQGLFAGFVNVAVERPPDIWQLIYNYIASRYYILNNNSGKKISNVYSLIKAIGKDERVLLFAILPKYIDIIYFYTIIYYGGSDPKNDEYRPPMIGKKYPMFRKSIENDENQVLYTTLLRPDYHSVIDTATNHAMYASMFRKMVDSYSAYLSNIGTKTNEELQALTGTNTLRPTRRLKGGRRKTRRRRSKAQ